MAHSGALTELPASILLPPTKSLFMIILDCWIVTVVIHRMVALYHSVSMVLPNMYSFFMIFLECWWDEYLSLLKQVALENSFSSESSFFILEMGAKYVVSILHNPMTYNRRSTMCKHVRRGGVRMMLVTTGLKANPCYGAIRKVLQKELAFMATKNVNKRIVRAIWCWLTVVSAIIYHVTKVLIFTKSLSPPPKAASFSLWHNFASLVWRLQAPID